MYILPAKLPDLTATAYGIERFERPGPYRVGRINLRLRDLSRRTAPNGRFRGLPYRELETSIWYPARAGFRLGSPQLAAGGPFPTILYSHGFYSSRNEATRMAIHFASHGIILVGADFPLSKTRALGGKPTLHDVRDQARDLSFLLNEMLHRSAHPRSRLYRAVDPERVGAAGISLGSATTMIATYHAQLHEPRIRAAVSIAGPTSMFSEAFFSREVPLLHVHGDRDALIYYDRNALPLLEKTGPWAQLLTVEGASHTGFAHIPLEAISLRLVGAVVAPDGSHPSHPDRLGCGVIMRALPKDMDFREPMGELEHGLQAADSSTPGARSILGVPAAPPDHQRRIAIHASLAFFLSLFDNSPMLREQARRFLAETLPSRAGVRLDRGGRSEVEANAS
jgi:dienelactone hydrolase